MRIIFFLLVLISIISTYHSTQAEPNTPSQKFKEYNDKIISGVSWEKEKKYFTKRSISKIKKSVEIDIPKYMKETGKSSKEAIKEMILFHHKYLVNCEKITLTSEKINGDKAFLIYKIENICTNTKHQRRSVNMIKENNIWKVDEVSQIWTIDEFKALEKEPK